MVSYKVLIAFETVFMEELGKYKSLFGTTAEKTRKPAVVPETRKTRPGRVGLMEVDILWIGQTSRGLRAKVVPRAGGAPFWVEGSKVQEYKSR